MCEGEGLAVSVCTLRIPLLESLLSVPLIPLTNKII